MRILNTFLFLAMMAASAFAGDVPVYGPARVGVEDPDLLAETVLDVGVLAVSSWDLSRVFMGDGITPGGIEIHPKGCVRGFEDVSTATTNLSMKTYAITFQAWKMSGDLNEFDFTWGGQESWMRFIRDTGEAYLSYNFTCTENEYTFDFAWTGAEGEPLPELQVSTNLMAGFEVAPTNAAIYTRPDVSHVQIVYTREDVPSCIFFRVFASSRMSTGIYFDKPIVPTAGITMGTDTWTEWPDVGAIATNAADAAVAPVSARVGALETNAALHATKAELIDATNTLAGAVAETYATAANLADVAGLVYSNEAALSVVTNAFGQKISEFETVRLGFYPQDAATFMKYVPTNFPTRELEVFVDAYDLSNTENAAYRIGLPSGWAPPKPTRVRIVFGTAPQATNVLVSLSFPNARKRNYPTDGAIFEWVWMPEVSAWHLESFAGRKDTTAYNSEGTAVTRSLQFPETVEKWVEWRNQQTW